MTRESVALGSLGLAGDGDEADVVRDLERAFGVEFGRRPEKWTTVGDIEADLLALYPAAEAAGTCGSAMAFRELRAALPTAARRARPRDLLAGLMTSVTARRMERESRAAGLVVSASRLGRAGQLGWLIALAGLLLLAPLFVLGHAWSAALLVAAGIALIVFDRGAPRDATLGEVARETAAMNFAHFGARGADRRPAEIWGALCRILAVTTSVQPTAIVRATRLFD